MLEEAGYKVSTHTDGEWKVTTPRGEVIVFKRGVRVCNRMPYIDLREHAEGLVMLETMKKNMEMFTPKEIERAKLARAGSATQWAPHERTNEEHCESAKSEEHPHQSF